MRIRREILTSAPLDGDYILGSTGYTWNVRRSKGDGSAQSVTEGARDKAAAVARLISLADAAKTDAWESEGIGLFRLIHRFRASFAG
jgi:hypothetical protein